MKYSININEFLELGPEASYILGLIWADGTLGQNGITLTGIKDDLINNKFLFDKFGTWGFYYRNTWNDSDLVNRQEQVTIYINDKELYNYLLLNGYGDKNLPLVLSKISTENQKYWWRGYVDGDGCFYFNLNQRHKDFFFTSYYEQNWSFVESLFIQLDIKYKIVQRHDKMKNGNSSSSSRIMIKGDDGVLKFGKFLYDGYKIDKIGYSRKYEKYESIYNWKTVDKYFKRDNVYPSKGNWIGTFNYDGISYYCGTFQSRELAVSSVREKKNQIILCKNY